MSQRVEKQEQSTNFEKPKEETHIFRVARDKFFDKILFADRDPNPSDPNPDPSDPNPDPSDPNPVPSDPNPDPSDPIRIRQI